MAVTTEELIKHFSYYVCNRQIGIAEYLAREFSNDQSKSPLKQSGYVILSIAMAYFEMIQQCWVGQDSAGNAGNFFVSGFRKVYPSSGFSEAQIRDIYKRIRNGMYHDGMTRQKTHLSRFFLKGFEIVGDEIHINPALVVSEIGIHFDSYTQMLKDPIRVSERDAFCRYCEKLGIGEPVSPTVVSATSTLTMTTPAPTYPG
ncbi:hypothetical protein [Lacunimicrobium album]